MRDLKHCFSALPVRRTYLVE